MVVKVEIIRYTKRTAYDASEIGEISTIKFTYHGMEFEILRIHKNLKLCLIYLSIIYARRHFAILL